MVRVSAQATALAAVVAVTALATALPTFAQAPTDAQRSAIRSACRSDYIAHCSSVPPGGMASLQCLQKNMSSLSSGCQTAVRAVEPPSETKAEPAPEPSAAPKEETKSEPAPAAAPAKSAAEPAAAAPKAAASSTAKKPSSAQVAAIRSACRSDYPTVCAGVPTGGAPALQCLEKNKSKVSARCQRAVAAVSGGAAPAAGGAAAAGTEATASPTAAPQAAAPAAPPLVLRPMRPREVLFVLRSACGADAHALCAGVDPGGGRILACLIEQSASLSPDCRGVLSQFAAQ